MEGTDLYPTKVDHEFVLAHIFEVLRRLGCEQDGSWPVPPVNLVKVVDLHNLRETCQ